MVKNKKQKKELVSLHFLLNAEAAARFEWLLGLSPMQIFFRGFSDVLQCSCWPLNNHILACVNEVDIVFHIHRKNTWCYLVHVLQDSQNIFDCRAVREQLNGQHHRQGLLPHFDISTHNGGVLRVPPIPWNHRPQKTLENSFPLSSFKSSQDYYKNISLSDIIF